MVHPASLFSQVLQIISRPEFQRHARRLRSDKSGKGFSSWEQFVSMLFCQLAQAKSLSEICYGLRCCVGRLNHLGVKVDRNRDRVHTMINELAPPADKCHAVTVDRDSAA